MKKATSAPPEYGSICNPTAEMTNPLVDSASIYVSPSNDARDESSVRLSVSSGELSEPAENVHSNLDGTLKAAVFGFSDGLCTNVNVLLGMYAAIASGNAGILAESEHYVIILTGFCGLLGGASSMACGEWLSASAEIEAKKFELAKEKWHHETIPDLEAHDMKALMTDSGISEDTAKALVDDLANLPLDKRLAFHAKFELGIKEEDTSILASVKNAAFMWISFAVGAFIPLIPWLCAPRSTSIHTLFMMTLLATALAVVLTSVLQARGINGRVASWLCASSLLKQILIVALAVGVTIGLNLLITGTYSGGSS